MNDAIINQWAADVDRLQRRVEELERALRVVIPICHNLDHSNGMHHSAIEPCPCEALIREALK